MLHSIDRNSRLIDVNNYWLEKLGYERSEVIGRKSTEFLTEDSRRYAQEVVLPEYFRTGVCSDIPYQFVCKNGKIVDVILSAFSERDHSGQILRSLAVLIDVTDRKRAETALREREERYRLLSNLSPVGIWRNDLQGNCIYANERTLKITGLSVEEIMGTGWAKNVHPDDRERMFAAWSAFVEQSSLGSNSDYREECRTLRPDGSVVWTLAQAVPERNQAGEVIGFIGTVVDITERKKAEEALIESEAKLRSILENAPSFVILVEGDGKMQFINRVLPGFSFDRVLGASAYDFIAPESLEVMETALLRVFESRATVSIEIKGMGAYGKMCDYETRIAPIVTRGQVKTAAIVATDITDRKQAEEERDRFFSLSLDMLCTANFEGYFLRLNPAWERILGYTQAELMATPYIEFVHPEDRARTLAEAQKSTSGVKVVEFENRYRCRDGSYRWLLWNAIPLVEEGLIYCVAHDITERKKSEEALRQSEDRFRSLVSNIPGAIYRCQWDSHWTMKFISDSIGEISGYPAEEFIDNQCRTYASIIHPDDREPVEIAVNQAVEAREPFILEYRVMHRDGNIRWVYEKGRGVFDEGGNLLYLDGAIFDISDRKQAEEGLRIAQENYRSIFENALNGIFQSTPDGDYICVNPAMARTYGYESPDEMIARVREIGEQIYVDPSCRDKFKAIMEQKGTIKGFQYQIYRQDGRIIWLEENVWTICDVGGKLIHYEGIVEDITSRKQEEEALKRQVQKLSIEIDQKQRQREVASYMQTDYFQQLQAEAENLRLKE